MMEASTTERENTTENAFHEMESAQSQQQQQQQFSCLYTKNKTQKRKIWQDGRLILKGFLAILHNANPPPGSGDPALDQCELTRPQINNICSDLTLHEGNCNLETGSFLITVEGPWTRTIAASLSLQPIARQPAGTVSTSMKKILTKKYRKPGAYLPPHPMQRAQQEQQQQQQSSLLGKRRQPLQPGELQRRHYGNNLPPPQPQRGDSYNRPPPMNQQQQHHHGPGHHPSSTNNSEYYAAAPPPPQSLPQPVSTEPDQSNGYRQAQFHRQHQPVSSNPSNGEHYHQQQQHQQQHNPYQQQGMHHTPAAQVQPLGNRQQPNNDNDPRTKITPPNHNDNNTYNNTIPLQMPFANNPATPSSSLAPPNQLQPLMSGSTTTNGMHPSTATATTVGRLPLTARKEQSSIFATGNGFDPSSFYGEDDLEEEEEDDDDGDDPAPEDSQFSAQPTSMRDSGIASDRSTIGTTPTTTTPASNKSPPRTDLTAVPGPSGGGGDGGSTLSTNELLSLFGAAPAPVQQEQNPALPPPVESHHQVVSDEARGAETGNKDVVLENDHFVLPPPSDSSSDEEEEE